MSTLKLRLKRLFRQAAHRWPVLHLFGFHWKTVIYTHLIWSQCRTEQTHLVMVRAGSLAKAEEPSEGRGEVRKGPMQMAAQVLSSSLLSCKDTNHSAVPLFTGFIQCRGRMRMAKLKHTTAWTPHRLKDLSQLESKRPPTKRENRWFNHPSARAKENARGGSGRGFRDNQWRL